VAGGASCKPERCIVAGDWAILQVRRTRYRTAMQLLVQRKLVFDLYQCRSPRWRRDCNNTEKLPTREAENKNKQRRVAMTTTCNKCGEALVAPDWSEFVSEHLVLNLWSCTKCGERFETEACMPADAESKISEKDWEQMFPPLLVA
jgi:transcription elongation factor Elf1